MRTPILLLAALLCLLPQRPRPIRQRPIPRAQLPLSRAAPAEAFSYTFTNPVEFIRVQLKGA